MIKSNTIIENILSSYKALLAKDYPVYRNHIYRIFNICIQFDNSAENIEKYAIASAFHDIGIWTHNFNYLKPSIKLATQYLKESDKEKWIKEISLLIDNHHKISDFKGEFQETTNTFRKADWMDVTNGLKAFNFSKKEYKNLKKEFSNKGFHLFLTKQWLKWFLKHPLNSLPMFKK
jgi:hypothetical protein